jgi:deoxyribodipyrimidine photolyase-related protein
MSSNILIFPTQLFKEIPFYEPGDKIFILEHPDFFTKFKFHKLKLIFHRATMKSYADELEEKYKTSVKYINFHSDYSQVFARNLKMFFLSDNGINKEIAGKVKKNNKTLTTYDSPDFLCTRDDLTDYYDAGKPLIHKSFYIYFRKKFKILLTNKDKPIGGKWSFDTENRKPFPANVRDLKVKINKDKYTAKAKKYINHHFPENPGFDDLYLPVNRRDALKHLKKFLRKRLNNFGPYEDASALDVNFGYHSVISATLNSGLLIPGQVVKLILGEIKRHNISSIEGFIRQLFWREYVRYSYLFYEKKLLERKAFKKNKEKLPKSWYTGKTGIFFIDHLIAKTLKFGYLHHIERLMFVGNFMLIAQYDPDGAYEWFSSLFIDSMGPWVMIPNVYGMSQFSCGNLMMGRPYICSSNYIAKMGKYSKRDGKYEKIVIGDTEFNWFELMDILYYNFIRVNKEYLSKNYSTANMVKNWNSKPETEKKFIKLWAGKFKIILK